MKLSVTLSLIPLIVCALGTARASDTGTPSGSTVVVDIDGTKLTADDVEKKLPGRLLQARSTYYLTERKTVDEFVEAYLLDRAAKAENLTLDALLERHVNSMIAKDPSEETLRIYYEVVNTAEPYEKVRPQIVERIRQVRIAKLKAAYVESLKAKANVAILLPAPRAKVELAGTPIRGAATAPVVLVEYADYECPYCQMVQPALDKVLNEYKGKVAFAFKDVPLPMHANAIKAAEATRCAEAQGKFWEYHDLLFSTKMVELAKLKEHARSLNLDGAAFDKCLDTGAKSEAIKTALSEAQDLGLNSTPSFFVNGRFTQGNLSYEQLRQIIEEELALVPGYRAAMKP
jgi:protein-disulfide isomerase